MGIGALRRGCLGGPIINYESGANVRKEGGMKKGYWVVAYRSISDASAVNAAGSRLA